MEGDCHVWYTQQSNFTRRGWISTRSKVEGECHVQFKRMWDDGCTTARETRVRNDAVGGLLVAEIT